MQLIAPPIVADKATMTPLKAFLVEDSPVIRENLAAALQEMVPMRVVGHAEGEDQAIAWLCSARDCDIAIVDVYLRQGSGLGVLAAVKDRRPGLECIVLSNYATADIRRRCLALGASRVFDKSAEIDALVEHCLRRAEGPDVSLARAAAVQGTRVQTN